MPWTLPWFMNAERHSPEWGANIDAPHSGECEAAEAERCRADELEDPSTPSTPPATYPVVDMLDEAERATYAHNGKAKRTLHRPVDLSRRRVVIVLHQMGVERPDSSKRWHLTTAHRVISPSGRRLYLHPLTCRLVEANAFDRRPWHGIGIEVAGNFEGHDGAGNWYRPDMLGRGRAGAAQIEAGRQEVVALVRHVRDLGGHVEAIAPHRVSGRDAKGRPNRQLCPGSRVWSEVGEWAGATLGLAVPGDGFRLGGAVIPPEWHGPHFDRCTRLL